MDGTNWISTSSATVNDLYSIIFAKGSFLAVGENATILETPVLPAPWISSIRPLGNIMQLTLNGAASNSYGIEASTDLANWTLLTTVTLSGEVGLVNDLVPFASQPHRFYRAIVLPQQ